MNTFKVNDTRETRVSSGVMLPVVELVIAIGLFTVISIFIVRFFTSANTISRQADDLSKGLIKAESVIELAKSLSPEETAKELGGEFDKSKALIQVYYDKEWKNTDSLSGSKYMISAKIMNQDEKNGILRQITVTVLSDKGSGEFIPVTKLKGIGYIKGGK